MKILTIQNNITDVATVSAGLALAKTWCATIGLDLEFTSVVSNKQFSAIPLNNEVVKNGFMVNNVEIFQEAKTFNIPFDVAFLIYDNIKITGGNPLNPCDTGQVIQMSQQWYTTYPEVFAQFLLHELCHYEFARTGKPDITHLQYLSPLHNAQPQEYYLSLLKDMIEPTNAPVSTQNAPTAMQTPYKYFQPSEIVNLKPELVSLLDKARGITGVPFIITSGYRTVAHNTAIGGVSNSAHLTGEAVDLACTNSQNRYKILTALLSVGFNRLEVAKSHIHCDISKTLPQNIIDFSNDN